VTLSGLSFPRSALSVAPFCAVPVSSASVWCRIIQPFLYFSYPPRRVHFHRCVCSCRFLSLNTSFCVMGCVCALLVLFVLFFTTAAAQHSPKRVAPRFPFLCAVPSRHRPRPDSARALSKQCVHPIFDASTRRLLSLPPFLCSTDFRALQPLRGTFAATSTMTRSKMASRIHMLRAV